MTSPTSPTRPHDGPPRTRERAAVDDVTALILHPGAVEPQTGDDRPDDPGPLDGLLDEGDHAHEPEGGAAPELIRLLDAVAAGTRRPQRIVVVGFDPDGAVADAVRAHAADTLRIPVLLRAEHGPRWQQIEAVRAALPRDPGHWVWFLSLDSEPEPSTLDALIAAARRSSRVGVVGPKLVRADQPRLLRSMGHHLTPAGRVADPTGAALVDQGQLDLRLDVLGVPLAGALVSSAVLEQIGGLDPAFGEDGVDGLDLSWRSHLAGHRVVVAPDAVVRQGEQGLGVVDERRTRRRVRQLALARGSFWAAPWRAFGVLVTSLAAAVVLLLVKRPAEAAGEWADIRAMLAPTRGWGARRRFRRRRTVHPRDLAGLHDPRSTGWRATLDTVGEALDPRARRRRSSTRGRAGSTESGPVSEEFTELDGEVRARRWSWPLVLAMLLAAVLTAWGGREIWGSVRPGSAGLAGPELGVAATDARGLWSSAVDSWRGGGLGHDRVAESWLLPVAGLAALVGLLPAAGPHAAGPALAWLLALAPLASVASAYLALRRSTRRRWLRAGLAVGWAAAAPLTVALAQGRVGPVVVHVLAPLLLAGYAVCAHRAPGVRRAAATFATVLALALAACWVPLLLVIGALGGLALLVLGRGSARWRGGVLAVLPSLLLLPWWPAVLADPVRLAGGAGATSASAVLPGAAHPWQLLLLHPAAGLDPGGVEALPLWLTVPLWLAALGALLLPGEDGRRAGVLVSAAVTTLLGAQVAVRTSWGVLPEGHAEAGLMVLSWPGSLLSLAGAALLLAGALAVDRVWPDGGRPRRHLARPVLAGLAVALVVLPGLVAAGWTATPLSVRSELVAAQDPLPAVAAEQSRGPAALRTLLLAADEQGSGLLIDLVGAEPEPARILRDRAAELAVGAAPRDDLEASVEALTGTASGEEVAVALDELGVGYVLLQAGPEHPVAADLDRVSGLTRVSSPAGSVLWRTASGEPARLRIVDADGQLVQQVPMTGPHAQTSSRLRDLPDGARLRVAEGQGWEKAAAVSIDGAETSVTGAVEDGIPLPAGDHDLQIEVGTARWAWHLAALALLAVTLFLALPVGRTEAEQQEAR